MSRDEMLRKELVRRCDADQAARRAIAEGGREAFERVMQLDDENSVWLEKIVEKVGWPGESLVGAEGSHAAWLLAQHADRRPTLQQRCLALLKDAVAAGEASPIDLAYLTDRVLLANKELQIYGTQMAARDGQLAACRLADPASVNERRAKVGLGSLDDQLRDVIERRGVPRPSRMSCPKCGVEIAVWLPEMGGETSVECGSCGSSVRVRPVTQ